MIGRRHVPKGRAAVTLLVFAGIVAGCGGGSTQTKPLGSDAGSSSASTVAGTGATATTAVPVTVPAKNAMSTTSIPVASSGPTAAEIAAAQNDLDAAGNSLTASDRAIGDSDVNRAKAQEGSAP